MWKGLRIVKEVSTHRLRTIDQNTLVSSKESVFNMQLTLTRESRPVY